jgi:large subunit ribosomal protein L6
LPPDVNVQVKGQDIYVSGLDNQVVGLAAGKIMRLTKVKNRDRRVFQDGIYLVEKEKCQL